MKKTAVVRIIIWSFTALLLTAMLVCGIVFNPLSYIGDDDWSFGVVGVIYRNADLYSVGSGTVTDAFEGIEINWGSGKINIEAYDGENTVISESNVENEKDRLRWRVEDGVLKIHHIAAGYRYGFSRIPKKDLTVKIPFGTAVGLKELSTDSTSADVVISGITASEKIKLNTVSGGTNLKGVSTAKLEIDTVSGDVTAEGEFSELKGDSVSGNISITSESPLKKLRCDSTSGDVTLSLPESGGFALKTDTVSGDINCEFLTASSKKDRRVYGDGSGDFKIDTVSGDITVKKYRKQ